MVDGVESSRSIVRVSAKTTTDDIAEGCGRRGEGHLHCRRLWGGGVKDIFEDCDGYASVGKDIAEEVLEAAISLVAGPLLAG